MKSFLDWLWSSTSIRYFFSLFISIFFSRTFSLAFNFEAMDDISSFFQTLVLFCATRYLMAYFLQVFTASLGE